MDDVIDDVINDVINNVINAVINAVINDVINDGYSFDWHKNFNILYGSKVNDAADWWPNVD